MPHKRSYVKLHQASNIHWSLSLLSGCFICLLLLPDSTFQTICDTDCQADQLAALQSLFEETNGQQWLQSTGWNSSADHCTWFGITCCFSQTAATPHGPVNCSVESAIAAVVGSHYKLTVGLCLVMRTMWGCDLSSEVLKHG